MIEDIFDAASDMPDCPCDNCVLWVKCGPERLACKSAVAYVFDRQPIDERIPTRGLYNRIFCDIVPYNEKIHGE